MNPLSFLNVFNITIMVGLFAFCFLPLFVCNDCAFEFYTFDVVRMIGSGGVVRKDCTCTSNIVLFQKNDLKRPGREDQKFFDIGHRKHRYNGCAALYCTQYLLGYS